MKRFVRVVGLLFLLMVLICGTALAAETSYVRLLGTDGTTTVGARVTPGEGEAADQVEEQGQAQQAGDIGDEQGGKDLPG